MRARSHAGIRAADMIPRRRFLRRISATAFGFGLGASIYTWRWEPHWLEIVERRLPIARLPAPLKGARLVQLSDLHIGPRVDDSYLLHTFKRVENLAPEFIAYTGDFISYEIEVLAHAHRVFQHLPRGSRATFGILGNHDYGPGWSDPALASGVARLAGDAGVRILRNEVADIHGVQVAGLDDLWAHRFDPARALANLDPLRAALALSHNPDTADQPVWEHYSGWILAGHTHGGQCKPPFLPPPLLPVQNRHYTSGEFRLAGGRQMYINRGVGHLLRVRFNARPEVTVFHLDAA